MLTITATIVIALGLIYIAMKSSRRADPEQLVEPRASIPAMGIQIICGNCAGEDDLPRKTFLDRFGCCSQCGGNSYILASSCSAYAQKRKSSMRRKSPRLVQENARVLPFGTRAKQAEKIAV